MAAIHHRVLDSCRQFRLPATAAAVYGPTSRAQLLQMVHLLHKLGLHANRPASRLGTRRGAPI